MLCFLSKYFTATSYLNLLGQTENCPLPEWPLGSGPAQPEPQELSSLTGPLKIHFYSGKISPLYMRTEALTLSQPSCKSLIRAWVMTVHPIPVPWDLSPILEPQVVSRTTPILSWPLLWVLKSSASFRGSRHPVNCSAHQPGSTWARLWVKEGVSPPILFILVLWCPCL